MIDFTFVFAALVDDSLRAFLRTFYMQLVYYNCYDITIRRWARQNIGRFIVGLCAISWTSGCVNSRTIRSKQKSDALAMTTSCRLIRK